MINFNNKVSANSPHIIRMPGNDSGRDFITTDPHGCLEALQSTIDDLHANDRLFLCGDLVDRGAQSLETLRYITEQKSQGKAIYAIRGNHEDIALLAIQQAAVLKELISQSEADNHFLRIQKNLAQKLVDFARDYQYGVSDRNFFNDFYNTTLPQCRSELGKNYQAINKFCVAVISTIQNGAGWAYLLTPTEREEVKAFIEPLPYMIRVNEAKQGTVSSFDIVHAAPLPEKDIELALESEDKKFTDRQIGYLTWARPVSTFEERKQIESDSSIEENNDDINRTIVSHERTQDSNPTYVGHNALGSAAEVYLGINVINLDVATVETHVMCVANHTEGSIALTQSRVTSVQEDASNAPTQHTSSDPGPSFEAAKKVMLQVETNVTTSSRIDVALMSKARAQITAKLSDNSSSQKYIGVEQEQDVEEASAQNEIPAESLKSFKEHYLTALTEKMSTMSNEEKINFARYLLESKNHPLAKERDYSTTRTCCFWGRSSEYSHQTRSMHKAIGMLLQGIHSNEAISIKKSLMSATKVTLDKNDAKTFTFDRYRRYI